MGTLEATGARGRVLFTILGRVNAGGWIALATLGTTGAEVEATHAGVSTSDTSVVWSGRPGMAR